MRALMFSVGLIILVAAAACGDGGGAPATSTPGPSPTEAAIATITPTPEAPVPTFQGDRAPVEGVIGFRMGVPPLAQLVDVRAADHGNFDRIVFEFSGAPPDYRVEYVPQATACASGEQTFVAGTAYLQVRFTGAEAHDAQGGLTFGRTDLVLDLPTIKNAVQTCDFEGVVTWVIGLSGTTDFAVTPLAERVRLVVDVSHAIDPQTPIPGVGQ